MSIDQRTFERLSAYLDGVLTPAEKSSVEYRLSHDPGAREALESLRKLRAAMKDLPSLAPPEAFYQRVWRDVEASRDRGPRALFSFSPMKLVGTLAAMGLVVVATHDFWAPGRMRLMKNAAAPSPLQMLQEPLEARQARDDGRRENLRGKSYEYVPQRRLLSDKQDRLETKSAPMLDKVSASRAGSKDAAVMKFLPTAPQAQAGIAVGGGLSGSLSETAAPADEEETAVNEKVSAKKKPLSTLNGLRRGAFPSSARKQDGPIYGTFPMEGRGDRSGIVRFETDVVRSAGAWQALWSRHAPGTRAPAVDFSQFTVLAVFAGEKPTAGYSVLVMGTAPSTGLLRAYYHLGTPPAGAFLAQVITTPYHWAAVPRTEDPVEFISR